MLTTKRRKTRVNAELTRLLFELIEQMIAVRTETEAHFGEHKYPFELWDKFRQFDAWHKRNAEFTKRPKTAPPVFYGALSSAFGIMQPLYNRPDPLSEKEQIQAGVRYIQENYGHLITSWENPYQFDDQERRAAERGAAAFEGYAAGDPARPGLRREDDPGADVGPDRREDGSADGSEQVVE
jgi:hypothetical protein